MHRPDVLLQPSTCSGETPNLAITTPASTAMLSYPGLKIPSPSYPTLHPGAAGIPMNHHPAFMDLQRAQQLYDYSRLHYGLHAGYHHILSPYHPQNPLAHALFYGKDPRRGFLHEEPKPSHSYIGLIAMALLSSREKKLVLSDIYQWILDNYPYFRSRGPGWRNSIRHNLSLNDCFVKAGRSANGKGHYWAVHPANVEDFQKGDFRRRKAQRKVRKHMGLAVPDDEDSPSPSPSPSPVTPVDWRSQVFVNEMKAMNAAQEEKKEEEHSTPRSTPHSQSQETPAMPNTTPAVGKKRLFDMASLLAPEEDIPTVSKVRKLSQVKNEVEDKQADDNSECDAESTDGNRKHEDKKEISDSERYSVSPDHRYKSPNSEERLWNGHSQWTQPSAFHSTRSSPPTVTSWSTLNARYGIMSAPCPAKPSTSDIQDPAQRWQETFAKIMARSYDRKNRIDQ